MLVVLVVNVGKVHQPLMMNHDIHSTMSSILDVIMSIVSYDINLSYKVNIW